MALKDWKRRKYSKEEVVWDHKNRRETVRINYHYGLNKWFTRVIEKGKKIDERMHSTKPGALEDAKEHMKKG